MGRIAGWLGAGPSRRRLGRNRRSSARAGCFGRTGVRGSTCRSTTPLWRTWRRKLSERTARSPASTKRSTLPIGSTIVATLPFLHRLRGEILLKRDPADSAPAEEAFRTAIAIATRARRAQSSSASGAGARETLPVDRPPRRRPRRSRACARRLCADAGNAGDRRGTVAARGAGGDGGGQGRSGAAAATDAACTSPTATRSSPRAASARRKRQKPSPEPASRRPATRTRPNDWRPTTAYGPSATCEANCHRCGRTRRPSSATSRRDPIRPRPASRIAPPGSLAGSPASTRGAGSLRKGARPVPTRPRRRSGLSLRT